MLNLTPSEQHAAARCVPLKIDRRDHRGVGAVYGTPIIMAALTTDAFGRIERTRESGHVAHWRSCTFYCSDGAARSSWGYRVECLHCGAAEENSHGSSVSSEDSPPRFAWAHRDCGPSDSPLLDAYGRLIS